MSSNMHQVRYAAVGQDAQEQKHAATNSDTYSDIGKVEVTFNVSLSEEPEEKQSTKCTTGLILKVVIGLIIVLGIAVSWVSLTQFVKSTYSATFDGPFFTIWFTTAWMMVCYPVHIIGAMVLSREKRAGGLRKLYDEDQAIFGTYGLTWWSCFKLVGPFTMIWATVNYMYARALGIIQPADVTAIFTTNTAFVYVGSWICLQERLVLLPAKSISVFLSVGGTILICYADGFGSASILGVVLVILSAVGAALYKVLFKRYMHDATYGQVSLFLTVLGWLNLTFLWPIMLILYYQDIERWDWEEMPWVYLCGSAALTVVFNFLTNYGIAVTFPLFIALGNLIGIPMNAAADWVFRDIPYGDIKVWGTILIILGFIIMLLPEPWQQKITCWKEGSCPCEKSIMNMDPAENWNRVEDSRDQHNTQTAR
ncbi:solute carrier family 35 member F3-like [Amphiura filiformis]|uniref:solute carrier family 35 member F3-like n=1 Tax=Amphiura filiformis TaxID=82378 RepID=UPI003B211767